LEVEIHRHLYLLVSKIKRSSRCARWDNLACRTMGPCQAKARSSIFNEYRRFIYSSCSKGMKLYKHIWHMWVVATELSMNGPFATNKLINHIWDCVLQKDFFFAIYILNIICISMSYIYTIYQHFFHFSLSSSYVQFITNSEVLQFTLILLSSFSL
jgi:hypothetical protein